MNLTGEKRKILILKFFFTFREANQNNNAAKISFLSLLNLEMKPPSENLSDSYFIFISKNVGTGPSIVGTDNYRLRYLISISKKTKTIILFLKILNQ